MAAPGVTVGPDGVRRCWWANSDPLLRRDHDVEWGRPVGDDRRLFEQLSLEAFQAGLSWLTVLRKRDAFRSGFANFEPERVARFAPRDVARLMDDEGIIRNRAKVEATINNARRLLELAAETGSFAAYVWRYEPRRRVRPASPETVAAVADEARQMSKDLQRRGWRFVGPTTVHSFIEAVGIVNNHVPGCAAGAEVQRLRRQFVRPR